MAAKFIESGVAENDNRKDDSLLSFINAIVNYVESYYDELNPPEVTTLSTRFTSNIGKAILKYTRTQMKPSLDRKMQNIITLCLSIPEEDCDTFQETFPPFFAVLRRLLNTPNPYSHIKFLAVICKFCLKFYRAQRPDLAEYCISYLLDLIENQPNCQGTFDQLETYAVCILQELEFI